MCPVDGGSRMSMSDCLTSGHVVNWSTDKVAQWLLDRGHSKYVELLTNQHRIDGKALLLMTEHDLRSPPINITVVGDVKRLSLDIKQLKVESRQALMEQGFDPQTLLTLTKASSDTNHVLPHNIISRIDEESWWREREVQEGTGCGSSRSSEDGRSSHLKPELWKALIALGYCFLVTWITAFVMVIVHDRVPDMKKYPPLPDIFLDNVPHIPWAFHMCEWVGTLMLFIWLSVLLFHKHRFILLRRFFALSGTVFLLRCVTMLITSLSVPGTHLECTPRPNKLYSNEAGVGEILSKMKEAYVIWKGAGMSIQGVRTCGDYMFSGHTVALTMLNFFITEYSPRDIYLLHTFTWLLNMFGIFFILSGHEHYSIDVFIAFYISSRLFLYYHTLANNQSLMQRDSGRTRIWFPLFSFFEAGVDGMVPNEYDTPLDICRGLAWCLAWTCRRLASLYRTNLLPAWSQHNHHRTTSTDHHSHHSKKKRK